jgi:opacity protein-like surface antigen
MKPFLIFLTLLPSTLFCQSTEMTKTKRISIGLTFSPDYCYRKLSPDATSQWIADSRDSLEIPKFGFTTGFGLLFQITKRLTLETGLQYSNKGEKTKSYSSTWFPPSVQPDPSLPVKNAFIYHYNYLDIPLKVNYNILTKRLKFFVSGGISTNVFLFQQITSRVEYGDGSTVTNNSISNGLSRINLAVVAGLGINYDVTNRLTIRIEPTYRRSITSIINAPIKGYLYSAGINTGIYLNL